MRLNNSTGRNHFLQHRCPFKSHHLAAFLSIFAKLQSKNQFRQVSNRFTTISNLHISCVNPAETTFIPAQVLSSENQIFQSILIPPLQRLEAQDSAHLKTPTPSLCRRTVIESIPEKVNISRFTTISQ